MKKKLLLSFLYLWMFSLAHAQEDQIKHAIVQQVETYPASTLKDIYKNFFQDAFGPGHLMSNSPDAEQRMRNYLEQECETAKNDPNPCPDYELTGSQGRFYRVNLSVINDGRVSMNTFLDAFLKSATQFSLPKVDDWKQEWITIEKCIGELGYRFPEQAQDSTVIMNILNQGQYASHHSAAYNEAYHPHYRLIEKSVFEQELLPLIESDIIPDKRVLNAEGKPEPAEAPFNR